LDYQPFSSLTLIAVQRYVYEDKRQLIEGHFVQDGGEATVTRYDNSTSMRYSNVSPKIAVGYSLSTIHHVYTSYVREFRAGGISPLSSYPSQKPLSTYASEYSDNVEIGSKNMFADRKLKLNVTLFYTRMRNGQVPVLVMPEALTLIHNSAKLTS